MPFWKIESQIKSKWLPKWLPKRSSNSQNITNFNKKSQKSAKMSSFQSFFPNRNRKGVYLIWVLSENRGIIKTKTYNNSKTENILNVISTSLVYDKFIASSESMFNEATFQEILFPRREKYLMKLTLNVLIFIRITFPGFCVFWSFPRIIIRAKYHETSHPENLIFPNYQKKSI